MTYTKDDVLRIFDDNKVLIGEKDVMPYNTVVEIFGKEATEKLNYAATGGRFWNVYCDPPFKYFYFRGVEEIATFSNILFLTRTEVSSNE